MKRSGMKAKYSPTEKAEVSRVEFVAMPQSLLVSTHWFQESWSVAEITEPKLYEGSKPARGSINHNMQAQTTCDWEWVPKTKNARHAARLKNVRVTLGIFD